MFGAANAEYYSRLREADACAESGAFQLAEKGYRDLLKVFPEDAGALNGLGRCFQSQGKLADAIEIFRTLALREPDNPLFHHNLAVALCANGQLLESFAEYRRHAELNYGLQGDGTARNEAPFHKVLHDQEQRAYLVSQGLLEKNSKETIFKIENCESIEGGALNPGLVVSEVEQQWDAAQTKIVVVDNFLNEEALLRLRKFCCNSTIWRAVYPAGYLGAFPEHGMGSPLLAQIASELREKLPSILVAHKLSHFWAFKYDSNLSGIAVHADAAAVNVNFWITPDDANYDPDGGGLIIWDKPAPMDWGFDKYNDDVSAARAFLSETKANPIKIPYRANRAVIFNSNLLHETDRISFKQGYANRRINITLLYGKRGSAQTV